MFRNYVTSFVLFDTAIRLRDGVAEPGARPGTGVDGAWTIAAHRADGDRALHSDVWERHPAGEEVLCVLSGAVTVYLRDHGDGRTPAASLTSGRALVVPAGCWHRLTLVEPADLLVVTPRAGTEHERARTGESGREVGS
ncbi:cupin domain-containing protein [Pseudonocardia halophobica]|uniref:cupin domain-containing protein n=1 Tax=Pseudonocardia halophobica TaxID=29401 RepID=UPI003D9325A3